MTECRVSRSYTIWYIYHLGRSRLVVEIMLWRWRLDTRNLLNWIQRLLLTERLRLGYRTKSVLDGRLVLGGRRHLVLCHLLRLRRLTCQIRPSMVWSLIILGCISLKARLRLIKRLSILGCRVSLGD